MNVAWAKAISQVARDFALFTSIAFACPATATETGIITNPDLIAEIEYGLVCNTRITGSAEAPDTDTGTVNVLKGEVSFASHRTIIPAILGVSFGVKSRSSGEPINDVTIRVTHPPLKETGTTKQSWQGYIDSSQLLAQLYKFEIPSELALGTWVISAYKGETLLYSIPFTVVSPANASASLKQLCKGNDFTS